MRPRFYSKLAIGLSTLFFSPILGSILLASNLKAVAKGKYAVLVVIGSIVWSGPIRLQMNRYVPNQLITLFIFNAIGAVILADPLWNRLLGEFPEYEKRPAWIPVLIFVGICAALLAVNLFTRP